MASQKHGIKRPAACDGGSKPSKAGKPKAKAASNAKAAAKAKAATKATASKDSDVMYKLERYKQQGAVGIRQKFSLKKQIGSFRSPSKTYDELLEYAESFCVYLSNKTRGRALPSSRQLRKWQWRMH